MRVVIASRIFAPEPAAAAFRLEALARALVARGHEIEVLTSRLPRGSDLGRAGASAVEGAGSGGCSGGSLRVRRARVRRDGTGAVRGYLPYLSFDIPLFFRLLARPRADLYIVEPPPTTGLVVTIIGALRRRPVVYYAADILGDAAAGSGSPAAVVWVVRWMERTAWRRAARVLSVSPTVTARLTDLGAPPARIAEVGNGVDGEVFSALGEAVDAQRPYALYAGTASEVHGARVFVEAIALVPGLDLVFLGAGAEVERLRRLAAEVAPDRVTFLPTAPAAEAARWLRGAVVAVASVDPEGGYAFAFPTKMYAAVACGTPILYAGEGPGVDFARGVPRGEAVAYNPSSVGAALGRALEDPAPRGARDAQSAWAREHFSLAAVAARASHAAETAVAECAGVVGS